MLLSVPYALKAGDAQTVGGLPASAFVLSVPAETGGSGASGVSRTALPSSSLETKAPVGGTGTTGYLAGWVDNSGDLGNSILFQKGTGSGAMIGLNQKSPLANLDVNGTELVRGLFESATTGVATASKGFSSNATDLEASSYNTSTKKAVMQHFEWQAEPTGNNTTSPGATLNLLFATDTNKPAETGLRLSNTGVFTFATGQTFPGTGTITGVTAGTDLTGGGGTGNVTLNLDTAKVPQLNAANNFAGNQSITGNLSDTGNITATGSITGQTANFGANNSTQVVNVTQSGDGNGITSSASSGTALAASGFFGLYTTSPNGFGVYSSTTSGLAIFGTSQATAGSSVEGYAGSSASGATTAGVLGYSVTPGGVGTYGLWTLASTTGVGTGRTGVWGDSNTGNGVAGTSDSGIGVSGLSAGGVGVYGASTGGGLAGLFSGNVQLTGKITSYNGVATVANGVPSITLQLQTFSSGGGISNTNLFTPAADGVFRITAFQECTGTSGGASKFVLSLSWTVPASGSPNTLGFGQVAGGGCGGSFPSYASGSIVAHVKGGTTMQYNYPAMDAPFQTTILIEQLL